MGHRPRSHADECLFDAAGHNALDGECIFEVFPITNRGRIEHVSKIALVVMDAEFEPFCWDCRVEHKVAVEGPGQARGGEVGQPI